MSLCSHSVYSFAIVVALSGVALCQTVSVQQYGARGDGSADDAAAIQAAINNAPAGSTVDFGGSSQTYLIGTTVLLQSNKNYAGSATIRLSSNATPGAPVLSLRDPQPANVNISGLTLDGNGVGNAFVVDFADNTSALFGQNITIQGITVVNSVGQYAIYSPGTLDQSTITGSMFSNCTGGIAMFSPDRMTITNNHFDMITRDNAITVMYNAVPVEFGQSLNISNNNGENLNRMGIEVIGDGITQPGAISVTQNVFTSWLPSAGDGFFGMSIFTGTNAQILRNVVEGPGTIGIEIGNAGATVADNLVAYFKLGSTVEKPNITIQGNHYLSDADAAIYVTNSPYSKESTTITGNYIADAQNIGINVAGSDWQGSQFTGNTIVRSNSWANDANTTFTGIGITPPNASVTVSGNSIVLQTIGNAPMPGFIGIRINGDAGSNAQSTYDNNTIRATGAAQGIGLYGNSPGSLNGVIVTNNNFINLAQATYGDSGQTPVTGGNHAVQCRTAGSIALFQ